MEPTATLATSVPVQPGSLLNNRYRLGAMIGRGGMAEVYRAQDVALQRPVAVKVFRHDTGSADETARRQVEVHIAASLNHPGLVTVLDAGTEDSNPADPTCYLVLEFVDGPTLAHRIARGALSQHEVAQIGSQLAAALAYVHGRDVVHRDVKPANILLSHPDPIDGTVVAKLTDFGVAHHLGAARVTAVGFTVGTANYLSPERVHGDGVVAASDIYSLGLVLLECLTGQLAYPGHGVEAALARLERGPVIPAELGEHWGSLLRAMTASDPGRRPAAAQVEQALHELSRAVPASPGQGWDPTTESLGPFPGLDWEARAVRGQASTGRSATRSRGRWRARRPVIGLLGAGTAAALVAAVFVSGGSSIGTEPSGIDLHGSPVEAPLSAAPSVVTNSASRSGAPAPGAPSRAQAIAQQGRNPAVATSTVAGGAAVTKPHKAHGRKPHR